MLKDRSEAYGDNMSSCGIKVVYDGPALETHEMDARELAPALLAIADIFDQANRVLNGDKTKVDVKVKGSFKSGSFGINFSVVQSYISQILDMFNSQGVTGTVNLLSFLGFIGGSAKGLLSFLKWLRNRPIKNVKRLENGRVQVILEEEYTEISQEVLDLFRDLKLRQALSAAITSPLQKEGITSFAVCTDENSFFIIEKEESIWFASPDQEQEMQEVEDRAEIGKFQLVSVSFRENNKWRFTDGAITFHAEVLDETFLSRVRNNEIQFANDDIFEVKLRKHSWIDIKGMMRTEYQVLEVLSYKSAAKQLDLPFDKAEYK